MSSKLSLAYDSSTIDLANQRAKEIPLTDDPLVNEIWEEIVSFSSLSDNWDSYGALRPTKNAIIGAMKLSQLLLSNRDVPKPDVIPVANGSIQLEWSCANLDLEIEICSEVSICAYYEDHTQNVSWEEKFEYDLRKLTASITLLEERSQQSGILSLVEQG